MNQPNQLPCLKHLPGSSILCKYICIQLNWVWHIWWIQHFGRYFQMPWHWKNFGRINTDLAYSCVILVRVLWPKATRWQNFIINICIFFTIFHLEWTFMMESLSRPLHNLWHWPYLGFSKALCDAWLLNRLKSYSIPGP